MSDRMTVTHIFHPEDVNKYPDLMLRFKIRELIVQITDPKIYLPLSLDQCIGILETEAAHLEAQIKVGVTGQLSMNKGASND